MFEKDNQINLINTVVSALKYHSSRHNVIPIPKPGTIILQRTDKTKTVEDKVADGKSAAGYGGWDHWKYQKQTEQDVIELFKDKGDCNIAVVTGKISGVIAFDIDGKAAEDFFNNTIQKINDPELENAINSTLQTKTGSGNGKHILVSFDPDEFDKGEIIKSKVLWSNLEKHSEISLKAEGSYLIVPPSISKTGNRYHFTDENLKTTRLSKEEILKILTAFDKGTIKNNKPDESDGKKKNKIDSLQNTQESSQESRTLTDEQKKDVIDKIKDVYEEGQRDYIIFGLSGFLFKAGFSKKSVDDLVMELCNLAKDEEKEQRLKVVDDTCQKWLQGKEVSGYKYLVDLFTKSLANENSARQFMTNLTKILDIKETFSKQTIDDFLPEKIKKRSCTSCLQDYLTWRSKTCSCTFRI